MLKKRILSIILSVALVLGLVGQTGVVLAAETTNYYSNAKTMSASGQYPTADGKVFAGWYQDEALKYRVRYEEEFVNGGAYAKFVDEDVLSVKAQLRTDVTKDTTSTELRLLTSVDSLVYESVGFDIMVGGKTIERLTTTVWETVNANQSGTLKTYTAKDVFDNSESKYIVPFTLTNIPNSAFSTEITVTPKWVTMEGTVVRGITRSIIIFNHLPSYDTAGDYGAVWYAPSTVKVEQSSTSSTNDANLYYQAVRNEYESAQLIISATKQGIDSFELYPSDLFNGNKTLSAKNVEVYVQKYIPYNDDARTDENGETNGYGYGAGNMPDALIPMSVADEYAENKIAQGNNGALWVTIYIPKNTAAGIYTGNFALDINDGEKVVNIPVEVEVMDYTLTDDVTSETVFSWRYDRVAAGELDGSVKMMQTYYEFFQDYRISLQTLPLDTLSGEEMVENVEKYYDTLTTYTILSELGEVSTSLPYYEDRVKEQILALAQASTSDRNLLDKAVFYFIDEPDITDATAYQEAIDKITWLNETLQECVDEINANPSTYVNFMQIANWESVIKDIPNIVPLTQVEALITDSSYSELLGLMNCICPLFRDFNEAQLDEMLSYCENNGIELWWYGNSTPGNPAPSYHIGDPNLLSSRSVSWMQNKYDVQGNLYWDAAAYTDEDPSIYNQYINVYENPYRRSNTNWPAGDGFLTYPGAVYGVYGPLPSIRLMSIRDGMEEYEILKDVEAKYQEKASAFGISDLDANMESLFYQHLYYEDMETMTSEEQYALGFSGVRENLIRLATNLDNGLGFAMSSININWAFGYRSTYYCYVEDGTSITIDGEEVSSGEKQTLTGIDGYTTIEIEVTNSEGESAVYTQYVGRQSEMLSVASLAETGGTEVNTASDNTPMQVYNAEENSEVIQSFDTYANITEAGLRVSKLFGASKVNTDSKYISQGNGSWMIRPEGDYGVEEYPWVRMRCDSDTAIGKSDFSAYEQLLMDVYNTGEEDVYIRFSMEVYDNTAGAYVVVPDAGMFRLKANAWTTCSYNLNDGVYNASTGRYDLTKVKYMTFTFLDKKTSEDDICSVVYLDNLRGILGDTTRTQLTPSLSNGYSFDSMAEALQFATSEGDVTNMNLSRVEYASTPVAGTTSVLGLGEYGLMGDATGAVWPDFTAQLGGTYATGTEVKFWIYVAADEDIAEGKTFTLESSDQRGGTANTIAKGSYQFNRWIEVSVTLGSDSSQIWLFVNLDDGNSNSKLGNEKVTVYMDEFRIGEEENENIWGPIL